MRTLDAAASSRIRQLGTAALGVAVELVAGSAAALAGGEGAVGEHFLSRAVIRIGWPRVDKRRYHTVDHSDQPQL